MNYVVIDTNVIVLALLAQNRQSSIPFSIVSAVFKGLITPVLTAEIMNEYRIVLQRRRFGFDEKMVNEFLTEFKSQAVFINPPATNKSLPDPKDVCFYDAAAVYEDVGGVLVTGNMKHFPNCPFAISPAKMVSAWPMILSSVAQG